MVTSTGCISAPLPYVNKPELSTYPERSQKPTLFVAEMQLVPAASMHVGPPLYTEQLPPHTLSLRLVQYVTVVVCASREVRPSGALTPGIGSPTKVRSASVVLSQFIMSSRDMSWTGTSAYMRSISSIGETVRLSTNRGHRDGGDNKGGEGGEGELELHCSAVGLVSE